MPAPTNGTLDPASRRRRTRSFVIAVVVASVLAAVYAFAAISYGASLKEPVPKTDAPAGGVAVTFVPQLVLDTSQELSGYLLLFTL